MSDHQLVRYKSGKHHFEVLVKPGTVPKYREGKLGFDNVILSDIIFKKYSKAERAAPSDLKAVFGDISNEEMLKQIIMKGDYQESTKERKEKVEQKRKEIINYIHKYYIDPKTKVPHPPIRIENALNEMKVNVDPNAPADKQVHEIISKMVEFLPLKKSEMEAIIKIKHAHLGSGMAIVRKYCSVQSDSYDSEGCSMRVALVPGDYDLLMKELTKVTKGDFQFEIQGRVDAIADAGDKKAKRAKYQQQKEAKKEARKEAMKKKKRK